MAKIFDQDGKATSDVPSNNGQHRSTGGTDRAPNNGQRAEINPASRSAHDRWGADDNMRVPADGTVNAPRDTFDGGYKR